jgi:NRAMP (natural resistance-associated macrophage protein)-like metal ion transporter
MQRRRPSKVSRSLAGLGPGLITGASDDDPSGIATYAIAGATLGLATLWTALLTLPLMSVVQFTCAKIGMVTGKGLTGVLRDHYPRFVLYPAVLLLLVANTINAGTDLGAIAAAVELLVPIPATALVAPVAASIVLLEIAGSYALIARLFKWLTLTLFAYVGAAFLARPHWPEVLKATLVPAFRVDTPYLLTIVAILGTTISPYLFFWQASEEVEEEVLVGRKRLEDRVGATREELRNAAWDTNVGMLFCNVIFYFVIVASAATLHASGRTDLRSAADAAEALRPLAGNAATTLFAIGLIGSGFLAVPVLTASAAYAVAEALGWPSGLAKKPRRAVRFYLVIAASTLVGIVVNFVGVNPMKALFWTAVLNGLVAPPLLIVILRMANDRAVMGMHVNGKGANVLGWTAAALMWLAAAAMVWSAATGRA